MIIHEYNKWGVNEYYFFEHLACPESQVFWLNGNHWGCTNCKEPISFDELLHLWQVIKFITKNEYSTPKREHCKF